MSEPFICVREVGLRDGLQMLGTVVPTPVKLEWLRQEAGAGVCAFEVTSFVSARKMPQFADAEHMVAAARGMPQLDGAALALNARGAERAIEAGAGTLVFVISASQAHSAGNAGRTPEHALSEFKEVMAYVGSLEVEARPRVLAGIATAFGCTLEGDVDPGRVRALAVGMAECGADEIALADTVGFASPTQVRSLCGDVLSDIGGIPLGAHLHDTRGLGLANVLAALEAGVTTFDAALGGLGGCPFAPGASGNIATEDLVYMLHRMGYRTGIDLERLLAVRTSLVEWLPGTGLRGAMHLAGIPCHQLAPAILQQH